MTYPTQFRDGARGIRSNQVHILVNLFPGFIIPGVSPEDFADKSKRPQLPQVAKLLKNKRFLYDREPKTANDRLEGHMRGPCVMQVLFLRMWFWPYA